MKIVASCGQFALQRGVNSGTIVREMCKVVGGGGGGRAELAQGGGPDVERIEEALKKGEELVEHVIKYI